MKSKKGSFANSATGYGKNRYNSNPNKSSHKVEKAAADCPNKNKKEESPKPKPDDPDSELNSGFGSYLRSDEGVEMMKMFIFANTIMLIITTAWPQIQEQYFWLRQWLESFTQN